MRSRSEHRHPPPSRPHPGGNGSFRRLIARIPRIVAAYIAASLAAGLSLGFLNLITSPPPGGETLTQALAKAVAVGGVLFGAFAAIYAALPSAVLVILAERFGWRRWPVYVLASALLGIVTALLLDKGDHAFDPKTGLIFGAAGAFAGFIYWMIAGRSAGLRRRETA